MWSSTGFRWKGKLVSEKVYKSLLIKAENGRKRRKTEPCNGESEEIERTGEEIDSSPPAPEPVSEVTKDSEKKSEPDYNRGRRIVELGVLAKYLWCVSCREVLSLENIEGEVRRGLGSILTVRCHKCLLLNQVPTGKQHSDSSGRQNRFDVNSKAVLGVLHSGQGWTHLNNLLACLNIPNIEFKTFKRYEREVGPLLESVARDSCAEAAEKERDLTLKNKDKIEKILPESLKSGFITPARQPTTPPVTPNQPHSSGLKTPSSEITRTLSESSHNQVTTFDDIVRVMVSYDMGWSRRASGRAYDSLNGYGAIIGSMSGLVLDYSQCNRKCRMCDTGHHPSTHDCRLNYWGSAKGMEAHAAKKIVTNSDILSSENLQVGVLVGDDDSTAIAACRDSASHTIVKQSDMNHTSKGVKSMLYKIEKKHGEINTEAISYLHRCFTYALAQNKGNSEAIAKAVRCIPHHAFNNHELCGEWCGYVKNPENYEHAVIHGGFTDASLKRDLLDIFEKLANNSSKFSAAASSNVNESLNAMMASKCPKSRCYSLSESADYRFSAVVGQKNIGVGYTQEALLADNLSPGSPFHSRFVSRTDFTSARRLQMTRTPAFKKKRIQMRKSRNALARRKESGEGITYESNVAVLPESGISYLDGDDSCSDSPSAVVFFDLETGGFAADSDILQIGAKCGSSVFSTYIKANRTIQKSASDVHGLTSVSGDILKHGLLVHSMPLRAALAAFLEFLKGIKKNIYLAAHNLSFDGPRIVRVMRDKLLLDEFKEVVFGMVDTLSLIREKTGRKGRNENTISGLADWLCISSAGAHDALSDVHILSQIISKIPVLNEDLISKSTDFKSLVQKYEINDDVQRKMKGLSSLSKIVSADLRKKMAIANISVQCLKDTYIKSKEKGIQNLLSTMRNGKPVVTKHKKAIAKVIEWLGSL